MNETGPKSISELDKDLALNALKEYKKKNYLGCLQFIKQIEIGNPNDFKVLVNKAVVEYLKSDLKKTEQFQKSLNNIFQQFKIRIDTLEEIDYCIAQFNYAVILYHQKQYTAAQRMLDRIYKFIEPMEENLAVQVSFLNVELQLGLRQPVKALSLISYLENNLMYGGNIPFKIFDKTGKNKKHITPVPKPISEQFQSKIIRYRLRSYLMNHSIEAASKELSALLKDKNNIAGPFLSANLEYLKGNFEESQKMLSTIAEDSTISNDCGQSAKLLYNNNMGVIHHALGKPNLACHYFQTALKEDISIAQNLQKKDNNDKQLFTLGGSRYHELMYNLGIGLLYAGRPAQAFDCLIICVRRYHRNSRLWLRIAECCIAVHKESNEIDFDTKNIHRNFVMQTVGNEENQKVVLINRISKDKKYSMESQSYAVPIPSLEFASLCLQNAKLVLPADAEQISPVPLFLVPGVTPPAPPPSPTLAPSNPASAQELQALKNAILIASAYVNLCLGNYIIALEYAEELLQQEQQSSVHKLLAHLYAAECLILLDKITEAAEHLNPEHVKDLNFDLPNPTTDDSVTKTNPPSKWFPNNFESVQAVLQYNIAVVKILKGELDQAENILKQIWQKRSSNCAVPVHIFMLVIYIELQLGHVENAKNLLKNHGIPSSFVS